MPEVLDAKDMKNWINHILRIVSVSQRAQGWGCLQEIGDDQVPLRPDISGGLDGLDTSLSSSVDLVQLLIRVAGQGRTRSAEFLIGMVLEAGMALDCFGYISNVLVVGSNRSRGASNQGTAGQFLEREAHLGVSDVERSTARKERCKRLGGRTECSACY